jgi:Ricin-type beta-trefoil lectin domain
MPIPRITCVVAGLGAMLSGFIGFEPRILAQTPSLPFSLQISPQGGGRCAQPADRQAAQGKNLQMQDCNNSPAQLFTYDAANMRLMVGGLCVEAGDGQPGTLVTLSSCNGRASQVWKIEQKREFAELMGANNLCLDIRYGSRDAGAPLQVWDCGDAEPNQLWKFVK